MCSSVPETPLLVMWCSIELQRAGAGVSLVKQTSVVCFTVQLIPYRLARFLRDGSPGVCLNKPWLLMGSERGRLIGQLASSVVLFVGGAVISRTWTSRRRLGKDKPHTKVLRLLLLAAELDVALWASRILSLCAMRRCLCW